MSSIKFCFEYRNSQKVYLPVNPPKLEIQTPGENSTLNIINLGDTSILKSPGLKTISFETFIPVQNSGNYIQANIPVLAADFYKNFFEAIQIQKEPINFIITELNISIAMSIEDFTYWWDGGDPDMHFKLSLKEYRQSTIKITNIGSSNTAAPTPTTTNNTSRQNTKKVPVVNSKVRVNGRLYRDSYGAGPGATEKNATRLISSIKKGRKCPYHVTTLEGGWRGWVTEDSVEVIS